MALETNQQKLDYLVDKEFKANIFDGVSDREVGARAGFIDAVAKAVLTRNLLYIDPKTGQPSKTRGTNLDTELNWLDIRFYNLTQALLEIKNLTDLARSEAANAKQTARANTDTLASFSKQVAALADQVSRIPGSIVTPVNGGQNDINALAEAVAAALIARLPQAQIQALAAQLAK